MVSTACERRLPGAVFYPRSGVPGIGSMSFRFIEPVCWQRPEKSIKVALSK